jgi:hypothetical protein
MRDAGNSWAEIAKVSRFGLFLGVMVTLANGGTDIPYPYRRQREETLVQGYALC